VGWRWAVSWAVFWASARLGSWAAGGLWRPGKVQVSPSPLLFYFLFISILNFWFCIFSILTQISNILFAGVCQLVFYED
jgi:hypothetical protein